MVKADLTRDYYADLELQPGASESEIKKQFRLLALKYHPDRNPGREAEVNSKFQTIQSAHEVLLDPEQRAKYDSGRSRSGGGRTYGGFQATPAGTPSGTRGNPWANAGSQWAPPPKPPPAREFERRKAPPPSAGAQRYANFATTNGAAPKANQDAEARRRNYEAWESMKQPQSRAYQPPKPPKSVPKEYTPQSGREESNSYKHPPPPKSSKPGYDEFRAGTSSSHSDRTSPTRPSRKSGFMPGTPGPDEPPASSTSAYFSRAANKSSKWSEPSARERPPRPVPPMDPTRQFREQAGTPYEPRLSTPYATHGGEKTNPFENINLNRSKSTRVPSERTNSSRMEPPRTGGSGDRHRSASPPRTRHHPNLTPEPGIARADSEINLGSSPKRTFSSANRTHPSGPSSRAHSRFASVDPNSSSDGDDSDSDSDKRQPAFGPRTRTFAKRRQNTNTAKPPVESQGPSGGPESSTGESQPRPRKPSLAEFRQWWSTAEETERTRLNDMNTDGTPNSRGNGHQDKGTRENPAMYATPKRFSSVNSLAAKVAPVLPIIYEQPFIQSEIRHSSIASSSIATSSEAFAAIREKLSDMAIPAKNDNPAGSPSGASIMTPPGSLTPFEATQRKVLEHLVRHNESNTTLSKTICDDATGSCAERLGAQSYRATLHRVCCGPQEAQSVGMAPTMLTKCKNKREELSACLSDCDGMGSPFRKQRCGAILPTTPSYQVEPMSSLNAQTFVNANTQSSCRFSFDVDNNTSESSKPPNASFNSSAENISTKFTAEDWHGKFEAGDFANDGIGAKGNSRTRSGSRSRNRSPVKGWANRRSQGPPLPNIDPDILQQTTDSEPVSSPGGTKFTAEEWARTFRPQNFAPPPYAGSGASVRPPLRTARRSRTGSSTTKPATTSKTAGNAAMVDEDESSGSPLEMGKRSSQSASTSQGHQAMPSADVDSPNAMDIDPPLDDQSETPRARQNGFTAAKEESSNVSRNVPVEPSRPEWRAGGASGASGSDVPSNSPKHPVLPARSGNLNSQRRTAKSTDEEDFKTNFDDLKNVEPMHHPATGLHSFNDLTSSLPFPSRAATTITIPRNFATGELDLPNPPRAPMVPPITNGTRPSMSSWESYLIAFKAYVAEWDIFNTKMIIHFVARKNQVDAMKPGWLEAFGDSDLDKYNDGMIEDLKVRAHWDVACEKHQAAMGNFKVFKGRTREGMPGGGPGLSRVT